MNRRVYELAEDLKGYVDNVVLLDAVDSTHAMAKRLIADMDEESQDLRSSLIVADRQDNGEGRGGRCWESPLGGLYLSWLRSGLEAEIVARLPMIAASAALSALAKIDIENARIKWPNDILVDERKIAGMLVFARHGETTWVTVGLGINVETEPVLRDGESTPATSVSSILGDGDGDTRRRTLAFTFVEALTKSIDDPQPALDAWMRHLIHRPGDAIRVRLASGTVVTGTLKDITPQGHLVVREGGDDRVLTGGDIIES
jgi:BirA family biotin operon repressor/biotin-[acetyl-CoA-carboxylase] ligase